MALKISQELVKHRAAPAGAKPNSAQILATRTPAQQTQTRAQVEERRARAIGRPVQRSVTLAATPVQRDTVSTMQSPAGPWSLFDVCVGEDLISLSFSGVDKFIEWLGFSLTNVFTEKRGFITYERPEYSAGSLTAGWLSDPCGDANGVEFGICDFTVSDFARLRRHGPTRDVTLNNVNLCVSQPRRRIDGTLITDINEYDNRLAMEAILGDFRRMLFTGNKTTAGQFDGLQRLIKTGYTNADGGRCEAMDSQVVNWNSNGVAGGSGATINGFTIPTTTSLIDELLYIHQTIKARIQGAPSLASQTMREGDQILVMPTHMVRCLLDSFTCWSVCAGAQYREVNLNTYEARQFRNSLNGGLFGFGQITLDGDTIPIMGYDYGTMTGGRVRVTSLTRSSTTATATTAYAHGLTTGDSVTISGATGVDYNITATVTVTGATTFTYTVANSPTTPDPSTAIFANITVKSDIYYLTGHVGDTDLMPVEALDMSSAPDISGLSQFDVLDRGRFLTWVNNDNTCITRNVELRPRLVLWAPWAQARIQNVVCTLAGGPVYSQDPTSLANVTKTFTTPTHS